MSSCPPQRSHRRTSIRIPPPRHQHRHPSPPPPARTARVTLRNARPKHVKAETETGHYTLSRPTFDHCGREIRSEIWQPDREDEYIALYGQRFHEQIPRRPRARTIASSQEVDVRSGRARVRSGSLSSSPLDHPQLRQTCPVILAAVKSELASTTRRRDSRRKHSMRSRPTNLTHRDSGYESDDADGDTSNDENLQRGHGCDLDSCTRISTSRGSPPNIYSRTTPFGRSAGYPLPGLDIHPSLPRPASPSNESSASTDDDNTPANTNRHALEYYLGNDDTWRETEILSQSSEDSGLSDDEMATRYSDGTHHSDMLTTGLSSFDMGVHHHAHHQLERRRRRPHRAPQMPKHLPLVPTCSLSRKRASMRAAWKVRFGRLFESDSEAGTEVEDELDWEGYESADARRIVAMRIHKAGGGDGRKVMEGKQQLAELLVKEPIDHRRLAARIHRRNRSDTIRGRERADTTTTIQPLVVDTCNTCALVLSPSLSTRSVPTTATESPTSTNSASLATPTSTPPTSVPNTPCPTCAQLSPRTDALQLSLSPSSRRNVLSPRSPPCKTTPLSAGTDPLTVFAVTLEKEKQRDFSGLLKHSPPPESTMSTVGNGLLRSVKSFFVKLNNFVDFAANAPLPMTVGGTCPLSPVMGTGGSIARDIGNRRRSASVPVLPPAPRLPSQRRRSYLRSPTGSKNQLALPGAPTSPYGYRVRPQQVSVAFPAPMSSDERMGNVAPTPVPSVESVESMPSTLELKAILTRPVEADTPIHPEPLPIVPIDLKGPPANNAEVRRRRASRSPSRRRTSTKRVGSGKSNLGTEKPLPSATMETNRDEMLRSRAVIDSKYWRVLAGEMEQRRRGGVEVAFMVRLAVEEGRNLPIFTSEERQAATGEIVVGGVWKASLVRCRVGGVGKGPTRIRSGLVNEVSTLSETSDLVSDSSVSS
ncbi:hypothetical protein RSOL_432120 [Rhizoctonia solani AG-3 Rhs1AP]|uniref:Uncharacterized protein n=1 Tax=Rhizoctonia solani AG-3 Rhs1AP TaxID=1086054 RepID=X8JJD0_9AGAM|nr:hypothetical protein RSOL_432120 [Rhizoctonia solani AG-3 Rhs1AP]